MSETLFSPSWYRVADLKPRLRRHVQLHRHEYRGKVWYILQDHAGIKSFRFSPAAYRFIGYMDGHRNVQELWDLTNELAGDDAPTQDEVIRMLGQLHAGDALICDVPPDTRELFRRFQRHEQQKWKRRLWTPLAVRFPLWDPDKFLDKTTPFIRYIFSPYGMAVWLIMVLSGAVMAGMHWGELTNNLVDRALTPQNLVLLWFIYPFVKAVHELFHGYATKIAGGEVHEIGIMLLVLVPVPYVDASAAWGFRDKRQRMLVGAIGIMAELFLGAIAMFIWATVEAGVVHVIAYNVLLISGISTLLFNGNPLLRFDGYYVLADALEIPNLGSRANKYLGYLCQRYLFGSRDADSPATSTGEKRWFVIYGVASFIYRVFIMFAIILYIGGKFFIIGVLLAAWAIITQVVIPTAKNVSFIFTSPKIRRNRSRAIGIFSAMVTVVLILLFVLPIPLWSRTEGVIWPTEQSQVRAGADGFIIRTLLPEGTWVTRGQPIIEARDPFLDARQQVLAAQKHELELQLSAAQTMDRVQTAVVKEELKSVDADLQRTREVSNELIIRSPRDGFLVIPRVQDIPGRFLQKGQLVAYVIDPADHFTIRAVVPQDDISLVRERTRGVDIILADYDAESQRVEIRRQVPGGSFSLPTAALGTLGGGKIPVDPSDNTGRKTLERVFEYEIGLPQNIRSTYLGNRVHVRFDLGYEAMGFQIYRELRQLFLRRFGV
jgi:putative peptide zinc metalloprotease protein